MPLLKNPIKPVISHQEIYTLNSHKSHRLYGLSRKKIEHKPINYRPGLVNEPRSVLYEMVNIERDRLKWSKETLQRFAKNHIGDKPASGLTPVELINLTYKLRKI